MLELKEIGLRVASLRETCGLSATEMAERGIFGVVDSSNLFIEIALEAGIFALIFFLVVLVIRIRNRRDYYVYTKNSEISTTSTTTCL